MKAFQVLLVFVSVWSLGLCAGKSRLNDLVARLVESDVSEASISSAPGSTATQSSKEYKLKHYDYYRFVLTWPFVAYLGDDNITVIPERFTIQRFMAQRNDGLLTAHYCSDDDDISVVEKNEDLAKKLKQYWPSLKGDHAAEWKEKWSLDGTCAWRTGDLKGRQEYFKTVLGLYDTLDIEFALKNINYHPINEGEMFNEGAFKTKLRNHYWAQWSRTSKIVYKNAQPQTLCVFRRNRQYLHDLHFCFDLELTAIMCPVLEYLEIDTKNKPETSTVPKYCVDKFYFPKSE